MNRRKNKTTTTKKKKLWKMRFILVKSRAPVPPLKISKHFQHNHFFIRVGGLVFSSHWPLIEERMRRDELLGIYWIFCVGRRWKTDDYIVYSNELFSKMSILQLIIRNQFYAQTNSSPRSTSQAQPFQLSCWPNKKQMPRWLSSEFANKIIINWK